MDKLGLIFITIIWGLAFVIQKNASEIVSATIFNFARFLLASIVIFLILKLKNIDHRRGNREGLILGIFLALATNLQQKGIELIGSGRAGFITGLYVIFVPVILFFWKRRTTTPIDKLAIALALFGLYLLNHNFSGGNFWGDLAVSGCAFAFAFHFIFVESFILRFNPLVLAYKQFLFCALFSLSAAIIFERNSFGSIFLASKEILYGGLISISIGYTGQLYFQKRIDPTTCAIILSLESVFAAFFGWYFLSERMDFYELVGCLSLFTAAIIPIKFITIKKGN